jgi:PPOX class probable F420-dependent enzyme
MAAMQPEQWDTFLRETKIGKLAMLQADGSPTVVPIWYEWDGSVARMFTTRGTPKVKRLQADPRAALTVETGVGEPEAWVTIEGEARVVEADAMPLVRRLAKRYYEPAKAEATLKQWEPGAANWVMIELTPSRVRSLAPGE